MYLRVLYDINQSPIEEKILASEKRQEMLLRQLETIEEQLQQQQQQQHPEQTEQTSASMPEELQIPEVYTEAPAGSTTAPTTV